MWIWLQLSLTEQAKRFGQRSTLTACMTFAKSFCIEPCNQPKQNPNGNQIGENIKQQSKEKKKTTKTVNKNLSNLCVQGSSKHNLKNNTQNMAATELFTSILLIRHRWEVEIFCVLLWHMINRNCLLYFCFEMPEQWIWLQSRKFSMSTATREFPVNIWIRT